MCLTTAKVYVCDNGSTDETAKNAIAAGAVVRQEPRRGKGTAVRRLFADVEADIYVMIDGDGTYDAASAQEMVKRLIDGQLDMVYANRIADGETAYRRGHVIGNKVLTSLVTWMFASPVVDMLSGYRVFSRRFVKSFSGRSTGFEIETELTIHALELRLPTAEIATPYVERPKNSMSKLSTWLDGWRILLTIIELLKTERPLLFFSWIGSLFAIIAIGIAIPKILLPWLEIGAVERIPTAVLVTGMMIISFFSFSVGLVLDTVTRGRREAKRLHYLAVPAIQDESEFLFGQSEHCVDSDPPEE